VPRTRAWSAGVGPSLPEFSGDEQASWMTFVFPPRSSAAASPGPEGAGRLYRGSEKRAGQSHAVRGHAEARDRADLIMYMQQVFK